MNKIIALASTAAVVVVTSLTAIVPAEAQRGPSRMQQQQFVSNWCRNNPRDPDCVDFSRGPSRWSDSRYRAWYNRHQHDRGFAPGAASIFGLAAGAIIGGAAAAAASNARANDHAAACAARYRSYDRATNTFLGTDGRRHVCTL